MRRATLLTIVLLAMTPATALAAGTGTTSTLSQTPPSWMTQTTATATQTTATATQTAAADPATTTTAAQTTATTAKPAGQLPFTGDDLIPETIAAVLLVAAGLAIRYRW
jgi:hypothetical protein